MAYIGKQPVVGNFVKLDTITTSATATYNLLNGGVAYYPQSANNCIVSLNGVIQSPTSAYTISGSTIVFSDALTSSDTIDFILVLGDVLNIGTPSDGTVTSAKLASGVSGLISWQSVQTTGFTAVAGRGYPCNTTSSAFTVTLPATPTAGDTIILLDYAGTFDTNSLTINPNGNKIEGATNNLRLSGEREGATLTYIDSTQGWLATSGINEGTNALAPTSYSVDFLVVAGGGGGSGGGGGAGGYRTSTQTVSVGTAITVTVGDGGAGAVASGTGQAAGSDGNNSSISGTGLTTITSNGGGGGGSKGSPSGGGRNGGSGGGGYNLDTPANVGPGGTGNTPSTSPSQGNNGGTGETDAVAWRAGGGGGGASATGSNATKGPAAGIGGNGGNGTASSITGSSVTRAGGGGGGGASTGSTGGTGGGGAGTVGAPATAGTANSGGGGGGLHNENNTGAAGGKGVVILSMLTTNYSGTTTGSPTVTTSGSNTILQFNGTWSYTA